MKEDVSLCSMLLLPMLGDRRHRNYFFANEYFIGAYIGDASKPEHNGNIILKYIFYPSKKFIRFERELITKGGMKAEYAHKDDMSVMYVFKVPEEFYGDYLKFLKGRYFDFSIDYKLRVLKFWNIDYGDTHKLVKILFSNKRQYKKIDGIYHHPH